VSEKRASETWTTHYGYDGPNVVRKMASNSQAYVAYPSSQQPDDQVVAYNEDGLAYHIFHNIDGSVFMATDGTGQVLEAYEYTAYGERTIRAPDGTVRPGSSIGMPFGFQGHPQDSETGLVYMRNRWYKPEIGRFISQDPIGWAGGLNLYAFVGGAPLLFTDPFGLAPQRLDWAQEIRQGFHPALALPTIGADDSPRHGLAGSYHELRNVWYGMTGGQGLPGLESQMISSVVNAYEEGGDRLSDDY
jgi:RHS repeat-associated protein